MQLNPPPGAVSLVLSLAVTLALTFALNGCRDPNGTSNEKPAAKQNGGHSHSTHGLHGGHLVELGDHEYHAEIVDDEKTGIVTVYIVDESGKKQVPVDATEIVINLTQNGTPAQFKLPAVPEDDDPQDESSRFQLQDKTLVQELHNESAQPRLSVTISGTSYTGKIEHHHEK